VVDKLRTSADIEAGVFIKLVCKSKRNFNSRTKIGNQDFEPLYSKCRCLIVYGSNIQFILAIGCECVDWFGVNEGKIMT
jgi:hypothetical protein